jgi:6-phosphogluconolactonase
MTSGSQVRYADAGSLADALCALVTCRLQDAIAVRGRAGLIVSGGKSPQALFERLARAVLPWRQVWVGLADERWVDAGDAASNERFVREHLLLHEAAAANFIGMKNSAPSAAAGAAAAWSAYAIIPRPFDLVLLGMGDDGHTASLFPANPGLADALRSESAPACVAMQAPVAPQARLSLNLPALIDAREIVISSSGDAKWRVFRAASELGSELELPVRAVLRQKKTPVRFVWSP